MAVKYVREVLLDEILLALETGPAASAFGTVKRGSLLGNIESFDSANCPAIIVESPTLQGSAGMSGGCDGSGIHRLEYAVTLRIHDAHVDSETAEDRHSKYECAVRVALSSYGSTAMTRIGWAKNSARFNSVGWVAKGQNTVYQIDVFYVLYAPASEVVDY